MSELPVKLIAPLFTKIDSAVGSGHRRQGRGQLPQLLKDSFDLILKQEMQEPWAELWRPLR